MSFIQDTIKYINIMLSKKDDIQVVTSFNEKQVKEILTPTGIKYSKMKAPPLGILDKIYPNLPNGTYIAGGAVLGELYGLPYDDIDIYCDSPKSFIKFMEWHYGIMEELHYCKMANIILPCCTTPSNIKLKNPFGSKEPTLHVIKTMWYPSIEMVIDSFDFRVCQFAIDNTGYITYNNGAPLDVILKRIITHRERPNPEHKLGRYIKYVSKGFNYDIEKIGSYFEEHIDQRSIDYVAILLEDLNLPSWLVAAIKNYYEVKNQTGVGFSGLTLGDYLVRLTGINNETTNSSQEHKNTISNM